MNPITKCCRRVAVLSAVFGPSVEEMPARGALPVGGAYDLLGRREARLARLKRVRMQALFGGDRHTHNESDLPQFNRLNPRRVTSGDGLRWRPVARSGSRRKRYHKHAAYLISTADAGFSTRTRSALRRDTGAAGNFRKGSAPRIPDRRTIRRCDFGDTRAARRQWNYLPVGKVRKRSSWR